MGTRSVIATCTIQADSGLVEPGSPWECPDEEYDRLKALGAVVDAQEEDDGQMADRGNGDEVGSGTLGPSEETGSGEGANPTGPEGDGEGGDDSPI